MLRLLILLVTVSWCNLGLGRTVILGFDGMDPQLLQQWMDSGDLPHFKKMAEQGHFQSLATTNPAQSPVAWSSFATGLNPGQHGIFDFIHRDPNNMSPLYSISGLKAPDSIDVFGLQVPTSSPAIYNKRIGKPFWLTAEHMGHRSSVLRVPVTYPAGNNSRMLSGMGVPDLLGTQGTYTFYATKYINPSEAGGQIIRVKVKDNAIETELPGPAHPLTGETLNTPLLMRKIDQQSVSVDLNGTSIKLQQGKWSDWVSVDFSYAGLFSLNGMVRMYLVEAFPRLKLYVSPININPQSADLPIAQPMSYADQLSQDIGLYHTLGMPEETWSLNDDLIDSATYLEMVKKVLAEREAMFFSELENQQSELLITVFVQTDRVSHMFWRGFDPNHPEYDNTNAIERGAIKWIYTEADRILGQALSKLKTDDRLMVISDHGFAPYYRHVHLNRWLQENDYLVLKDNVDKADFVLQDIDWRKTRAYAMGLNGIYVNLIGREKNGIVESKDKSVLMSNITAELGALYDEQLQQPVIRRIDASTDIYHPENRAYSPDLIVGYNKGYRASWQTVLGEAPESILSDNHDKWSGDHCIDPSLVPGVLLTNFKIDNEFVNQQSIHISDIGALALTKKMTKESSESIAHESGYLDVVQTIFRSILDILFNHLSVYFAAALAAMVLGVWLLIINKVCRKLLMKGLLRLVLKNTMVFLSIVTFLYVVNSVFKEQYSIGDTREIRAFPISQVNLPELNWFNANGDLSTTGVTRVDKNRWHFEEKQQTVILKESDGYVLLNSADVQNLKTKSQKRWYHHFFSNQLGYISPYSQVDKITIKSVNNDTLYLWLCFVICFFLTLMFHHIFVQYRSR